jgi:hypothetical protein
MRAAVFAVLVVGMFGSGRSMADAPKDKQEQPDDRATSMTAPISLDFTMKQDGGKLHLDYTIANHSKDAILCAT